MVPRPGWERCPRTGHRGAGAGPALFFTITIHPQGDAPMKTCYVVSWTHRDGTRHATAPNFPTEGAAEKWRAVLIRDSAVTSARIVPVFLDPLPLTYGTLPMVRTASVL